MNRVKYILSVFLTFSFLCASAQELTEEDKRAFEKRVTDKVEEFQGYLSTIVNTQVNMSHRKAALESAMYLFVGNCEPYNETDEQGHMIKHRAVRMQVSSATRQTKTWQTMKKYLYNQLNNTRRYARVVIRSADAVRVGKIHKVDNGRYECVATFYQEYISYSSDGRIIYNDRTQKKVKIYITASEMPDGSIIYEAKLGDVYVVSTERV